MLQPTPMPSFELSDFDRYQWTEILDRTNPKECRNYSKEFQTKAVAYQSSGDSLAQEIFKFLSEITSILMDPHELQSASAVKEMMSAALSNHHLAVLRRLVKTVTDPEMQARIADILWICKRDPEKAGPIRMARVAVESYLQSAKTLENTENWMSCYARLKRAAQLAPLIDGKKSTVICCTVAKHIDNLIDRYAVVDNEFLTGSAMKVLQEDLRKSLNTIQSDLPSYATKYATIAAQKAVFAEKFQDYHKAFYQKTAYRKLESEWHKIAGNREAERNAKLHIAEAEVWYAQQAFVGNEPNSYSVAAGRIKKAIGAFRKIKDTFGQRQDTSERIQELHKQMLNYQEKSISQMSDIPIAEPDQFYDPEMQQVARELVKGKTLRDALYSLAFRFRLIRSLDDLRTEAKQDMELYKLSHLIPTALVDEKGKTKAIGGGNGEDSLEDSMFKIANFYQGWYGLNFIASACEQICSEHDVNSNELSFIVNENPFIPKGREPLYVRGLLAGLQGDTVVALHLLVPQLENSLRHILKQQCFIASNLTSGMIQDEYTLNKVLELPDLKHVLPENIIFTLRGLLVERMGSNLRNEICHGLFDYGRFFTPQLAYLWWLTLHLCLFPSYKQWAAENKEE